MEARSIICGWTVIRVAWRRTVRRSRSSRAAGAIDHHHVVILSHALDRDRKAGEEGGTRRLAPLGARHEGGIELELLEFEVRRGEVEPGEVGLADHLPHRALALAVADGVVDRRSALVRANAEQGGQAGLRIRIDRQHTVAVESQVMRQPGRMRRLGRAALEVRQGDDLEVLALLTVAMGKVASSDPVDLVQVTADGMDLGEGKIATSRRPDLQIRREPVEGELTKTHLGDAEEPCRLAGRERAAGSFPRSGDRNQPRDPATCHPGAEHGSPRSDWNAPRRHPRGYAGS